MLAKRAPRYNRVLWRGEPLEGLDMCLQRQDRGMRDAGVSKKATKQLRAQRREQPARRPQRPSSAAGSAHGEPPGLDVSQELPADILRKVRLRLKMNCS